MLDTVVICEEESGDLNSQTNVRSILASILMKNVLQRYETISQFLEVPQLKVIGHCLPMTRKVEFFMHDAVLRFLTICRRGPTFQRPTELVHCPVISIL